MSESKKNDQATQEKNDQPTQAVSLWDKQVTVKLPWIKGQPDAVNVGVNGRFFLIKRGVEVQIPYPVFEVLQHSEKMEMMAAEYEQELTQKAEKL